MTEPDNTIEKFDVTIPQQYLDAIAAHEAKIDAQMEVWKTYISELSGSDTLRRLAKQMSMLSQPLEREIEAHKVMLSVRRGSA